MLDWKILFRLSQMCPATSAPRPTTGPQGDRLNAAPAHERHFYSSTRAFGRFGMRIFEPQLMATPHWHGHIEANFAIDHAMDYDVDSEKITVPANRLCVFWAGIPHQLTRIDRSPDKTARLCNIYLPLDSFLMMNHIAPMQVAMLGGGMILLPETLCDEATIRRWYADYRSGDFERTEVMKMELNALFRRAYLGPPDYMRAPRNASDGGRALSSAHIGHVIAMVRFVLENLEKPLKNAQITAVTGLHENYALGLFTQIMRMPLKQFLLRMRLMRARALLVESKLAIASVAEASGFTSISQFYAQFKAAYGTAPNAVREQYLG
jgi:AraC family transcriptional regulator, melibiose operon regulatory protein